MKKIIRSNVNQFDASFPSSYYLHASMTNVLIFLMVGNEAMACTVQNSDAQFVGYVRLLRAETVKQLCLPSLLKMFHLSPIRRLSSCYILVLGTSFSELASSSAVGLRPFRCRIRGRPTNFPTAGITGSCDSPSRA